MTLVDELQKLSDLYDSGSLTDEEYAQAKAKLLASGSNEPTKLEVEGVVESLAEVRYQNDLARIDREWELEREQYMVQGRSSRYLPSAGDVVGAMVAILFGVFWTVGAFTMTSHVPDYEGFSLIKVGFPLFGVVFVIMGFVSAVNSGTKAVTYKDALKAYQDRRNALRRE